LKLSLLSWFIAAAATAAALDVGQVSLATGGQPILRLAGLVLTLYLALGLIVGVVAVTVIQRKVNDPPRRGGTAIAVAFVGFSGLFLVPYLNIVHLPSITDPVTIAVNLAVLGAALVTFLFLRRSRIGHRLARSARLAAVVTAVSILTTFGIAAGDRDESVTALADFEASDPDVFVIVIDSLRQDRTGPDSPTPELGALAMRGRKYSRAYSQASWTKPSVASLFTSLYPSAHGANLRRDRLPAGVQTLPEVLAARGYRTAVFSANPWISPAFGFERGVRNFYESETETFARLVMILRMIKMADKPVPGRPLTSALRSLEGAFGLTAARRSNCERDTAIVDAFTNWLEAGETSDRPSFAYFHLMSPHIPYDPPDRDHDFTAADQVALLLSTDPLPEGRRQLLLDLYDATIEHGDQLLGRLVDAIDLNERPAGSVIVVTADHGEEFYEHGRWGHGKSLYDEVVNVPLVIAGTGVEAGTSSAEPAMLIDVLPTIAGITEAPANPQWQGRNLLAAAPSGDGGSALAYAELMREGGFESFMLVRDGTKYIETVTGVGSEQKNEFYDLDMDPAESKNLTSAQGREMSAALAQMRERSRAGNVSKQETDQTEIDDAARQRLEALGYVDH
jgi:arylsulfatase A-like enzyme